MAGAGADRRQGRVEQNPHFHQLVGAAAVGEHEQRRPAGHDREAGEQQRRRPLLLDQLAAMRGDRGRDQARLRVGRCDPRLGGLDRLRRRGLLRAQPLGVIVGLGRDLVEPRQLGVGGRLFRARALDLRVERFAARLAPGALAASSGQRSKAKTARIPSTFAMIGMVRKDRCRPKQLLGQHRPDQQMRPGRGPERQQQVGAAAFLFIDGRPRRRSGSGLRACRRRATLRASWRNRSKTAPLRARRARSAPHWPAVAGILPPRSGSSVTLVGHAIRFR